MPQIAINYPDDLLVALGTSADAFEQEARFALAAKLYEQGRLSSGKAAGIAGIDRVTFLVNLHRAGIAAVDLDDDEMQHEARYAARE
jgi:predicted HTH domain antitoxin